MALRSHGVYIHGPKQPQTENTREELLSVLNTQSPFSVSLLPYYSVFKTISVAFTLCFVLCHLQQG